MQSVRDVLRQSGQGEKETDRKKMQSVRDVLRQSFDEIGTATHHQDAIRAGCAEAKIAQFVQHIFPP